MGRRVYFDEDRENAIIEREDGSLTKLLFDPDEETFKVPRDVLEEVVGTTDEAEEE